MNQTKKIFAIVLSCIAVICLTAAAITTIKYIQEDKQSQNISTQVHTVISESLDAGPIPTESAASEETDTPEMEAEATPVATEVATLEPVPTEVPAVPNPYAEYYLANEDMAGWLSIPGTVIDYPIMWTPEDENYYLYRDFDKNSSTAGSLILDTDSCVDPLTTNLIIHGHNMKSGSMFGTLRNYEDEDFYKEHRQIILYTEECQRNYEVIAVFRSQVYKKTDNVFKFYKFFQADTEEEFYDFYDNIKALSLYDTGVTAEFGDHFITLSTCTYHVEQGRFVVVAKEVEKGDQYLPIEE